MTTFGSMMMYKRSEDMDNMYNDIHIINKCCDKEYPMITKIIDKSKYPRIVKFMIKKHLLGDEFLSVYEKLKYYSNKFQEYKINPDYIFIGFDVNVRRFWLDIDLIYYFNSASKTIKLFEFFDKLKLKVSHLYTDYDDDEEPIYYTGEKLIDHISSIKLLIQTAKNLKNFRLGMNELKSIAVDLGYVEPNYMNITLI